MRPGERGDANAEFPTPREAISPVLKPERFRSTRRHDTTRDVSPESPSARSGRVPCDAAPALRCAHPAPILGDFQSASTVLEEWRFFSRREWVFGNVTNVTYYQRFVRRCPDTIVLDAQHGHPADSSVSVVVVVSTPPRATRRNIRRRDVRDGECVRRRAARGVFPPRRLSPSSTRRARVDSQTPPSLRACVRPVASPVSDREARPGRARLGVEDGDRGPRSGRRGVYIPLHTYPRVRDATPIPQPRRARCRRTVVRRELTSN